MKNNYHTSIILIAIVLILPLCVSAQNALLKKANTSFDNLAFIDAIDSYHKIINNGNGTIEVYQRLADAYYFNSDLENAGRWYERMIEYREKLLKQDNEIEEFDPEYYYKMAQCYRHLMKYDQANEMIVHAQGLDVDDSRAKRLENHLNYLEDIEKQSGRYEITNFPENSAYSDFAPSMYNGKLVFSSSRNNRQTNVKNSHWTKQPYLDLYTLITNDSLHLSYTKKFSKQLSSRLHESTSCFTGNGSTIYFTRNNILKGVFRNDSLGVSRLKIFKATIDDNSKWVQIKELPFNNDQYSVAHPALSPDEKELFFVSDMPGGYGMSDIYKVTILEDGSFGEPVNMGGEINTEGRDTFPFISKSNRMYFSSDGHLGLGGFDIFMVELTDEKQKIYNVGKPVNSIYDDVTFIVNEDTKKGYFASNRVGGRGDDDIYNFREIKPIETKCNGFIDGVVLDKKTKTLLREAAVIVVNKNKDTIYSGSTNEFGAFGVFVDCNIESYKVFVTKTAYKSSIDTLILNNSSPYVKKELLLENDVPSKGVDLAKLLKLQPIYFTSNKALIRDDIAQELDRIVAFMQESPTVKIEIGSHTDSKGSDAYNLKLSTKRATATANYIISKGVDSTRVKSKGYGETLLQNKCSNGVRCSKEEHQQNRRSEFIVTDS